MYTCIASVDSNYEHVATAVEIYNIFFPNFIKKENGSPDIHYSGLTFLDDSR